MFNVCLFKSGAIQIYVLHLVDVSLKSLNLWVSHALKLKKKERIKLMFAVKFRIIFVLLNLMAT